MAQRLSKAGVERLVASVTISAPRERVFAYLDDPALMKQWIAGLEEFAFDKPGIPRGVGTGFHEKIRGMGRSREYAGEVIAYRPPQEVGTRLTSTRFSLDVTHRLTAAEGGTRIEQIVALRFLGWPGRLTGGIAGWLLRRHLAQALARLKSVVERAAGTMAGTVAGES